MRARTVALALASLIPAGAASADDRPEEPTSHWKSTAAIDAAGLAVVLAGAVVEGRDTDELGTGTSIATIGAMLVTTGAPIVHLLHGQSARGAKSFLLRTALGSMGMIVAIGARAGCEGLVCELDYAGYGMLGGLALAAFFDAAVLKDERTKPPAWTPQVAAGANGVRVGAAWTW